MDLLSFVCKLRCIIPPLTVNNPDVSITGIIVGAYNGGWSQDSNWKENLNVTSVS